MSHHTTLPFSRYSVAVTACVKVAERGGGYCPPANGIRLWQAALGPDTQSLLVSVTPDFSQAVSEAALSVGLAIASGFYCHLTLSIQKEIARLEALM